MTERDMLSMARLGNVLLGAWLVASAFVWPHNQAQLVNALVTGGLCVAIAAVAVVLPRASYANVALGFWLFLSTFALPVDNGGTVLHNAAVAIGMIALAVAPAARPIRAPDVWPRSSIGVGGEAPA